MCWGHRRPLRNNPPLDEVYQSLCALHRSPGLKSDKVTWPPEGLGDGKISTTSPTAGALPTSAATWRQAGRARGLVADERAHVGERGPPALVTVADEVTG
jgi:hypothetical protein